MMTVTKYTVKSNIPTKTRIAVLADVHDCVTDELKDAVRSSEADMIVFPGDLTNIRPAEAKSSLELLCVCSSLAPVFVSRGNHERLVRDDDIAAIEKTGAVWLDDAFVTLGGISVGGLSSGFREGHQGTFMITPPPDEDFIARFASLPGFHILLSHHPEYYKKYIRPTCIELTFSGHAHGGQWRFFGRGMFAPGQGIFPRYTDGAFDGGRLIVSRGISTKGPLPRIFNRPELVIVDVEPADRRGLAH